MTKRPKPSATKFNRCTLNVRDLPLERFRLERDGRKWKQAARSRSDLLSRLATYANPDGTFESEDRKKNFSPGAEKLLRHYAERTLYRLTNDLGQLGLLSWERENKHYGRRTYRIHFQPEKHLPHSQNHLPHSQKTPATMTGDNTCHHDRCYHLPHSPESKQGTRLADSSSTSIRLLESLPSPVGVRSAEAESSPNTQLHSGTAAAFRVIGFEKPFGQPAFQEVWLRRFASRNGEWLTAVMEATIQECNQRQIGVPPQFFDAKRDVEKREQAEFENKHRTAPL